MDSPPPWCLDLDEDDLSATVELHATAQPPLHRHPSTRRRVLVDMGRGRSRFTGGPSVRVIPKIALKKRAGAEPDEQLKPTGKRAPADSEGSEVSSDEIEFPPTWDDGSSVWPHPMVDPLSRLSAREGPPLWPPGFLRDQQIWRRDTHKFYRHFHPRSKDGRPQPPKRFVGVADLDALQIEYDRKQMRHDGIMSSKWLNYEDVYALTAAERAAEDERRRYVLDLLPSSLQAALQGEQCRQKPLERSGVDPMYRSDYPPATSPWKDVPGREVQGSNIPALDMLERRGPEVYEINMEDRDLQRARERELAVTYPWERGGAEKIRPGTPRFGVRTTTRWETQAMAEARARQPEKEKSARRRSSWGDHVTQKFLETPMFPAGEEDSDREKASQGIVAFFKRFPKGTDYAAVAKTIENVTTATRPLQKDFSIYSLLADRALTLVTKEKDRPVAITEEITTAQGDIGSFRLIEARTRMVTEAPQPDSIIQQMMPEVIKKIRDRKWVLQQIEMARTKGRRGSVVLRDAPLSAMMSKGEAEAWAQMGLIPAVTEKPFEVPIVTRNDILDCLYPSEKGGYEIPWEELEARAAPAAVGAAGVGEPGVGLPGPAKAEYIKAGAYMLRKR